jgi:hypothetical protein
MTSSHKAELACLREYIVSRARSRSGERPADRWRRERRSIVRDVAHTLRARAVCFGHRDSTATPAPAPAHAGMRRTVALRLERFGQSQRGQDVALTATGRCEECFESLLWP